MAVSGWGHGLMWFMAAVLLAAGTVVARGDDARRLVVIDGADYFGGDYRTLENVSLADCEAACLADTRCRALTFNRNSGWCFLKEDYGELRAFDGAVSARIDTGAPHAADRAAMRRSELAFLPSGYRDEADDLRRQIARAGDTGDGTFDQLLADARAAEQAGNRQLAVERYRSALRLAPDDHGLWLRLAGAAMAVDTGDWQLRRRLQQEATGAAVNGYLTASGVAERAAALAAIGRSLERRDAWRPAIRATRSSLELADDAGLRTHLDEVVAEHGFRVVDHTVSSDARDPRICVKFSDPLDVDGAVLADFVRLDDPGLAVEPEAQQICIDGVRHGERYRIVVRAGLPANDGERLAKAVELDVYVRDRAPSVRFPGRAYVLPSGGDPSLPVVSVNTDRLDAALYRIGDRALGGFAAGDDLFRQLSRYDAEDLAERRGERLWRGQIDVRSALNEEVTTAVPVAALLADAGGASADGGSVPRSRMSPGVYVLTARPRDGAEDALATQWFVVSDLGLTALSGNDGLHVLVRSLTTAEPVAGVALRLSALNEQLLGETTTDARGYARFEPGLLRGTGGNAPVLLAAETAAGDYGFLDLDASPFDLSDRGVEGRAPPKPLDVYLVADRGIYRPGETVELTALVRDTAAAAVGGVPLTFVVRRPDGVELLREQVPDQGLGGRALSVPLLADAMRGAWQVRVYADPKGDVLAQAGFLVEDFAPERLAFVLSTPAEAMDPDDPPAIDVDARFLYGAPAADLEVEGTTRISAADGLGAWPGFRFGLADEDFQARAAAIPVGRTGADGKARLAPELPDFAPVSRPLTAEVSVRVLDGAGRPVEREMTLPVADRRVRIGVRPLFDGAVDEGGNAAFDVIALGADGQRIALTGLPWTLSRVQTSYQWYRTDGDWKFEPLVSRTRVASGAVDVPAAPDDAGALGRIEVPVDWGGYELRIVSDEGPAVPASVQFEAGWYVAPKAFDTPDVLKVSLDKPRYRIGETARVRLEPRFPGLALVMVVDDGLKAMQPARVPAEGTTVELPVTADWGPGAYVTAVLYRGMDIGAKRMPKRAIGLQWAAVEPADRQLAVRLDVAEKAAPRGPLAVGVGIDNLPAGAEAYVAVAAVDVGILNLTDFPTWAPDAWYFGQRRLGLEIRDLYGRLIDRMQGEPGRVRSGAGSPLMLQFDGPPPSEALVAFHSGLLRVDAEGRASARFELPDFNGSVRVMAMAWSAAGVGHAARELVVRDPVVVSAAMPRFMAPGDRSRVLVELAHLEGPAGAMELSLASEAEGLVLGDGAGALSVDLPEGGRRQVSVDVEAAAAGDHPLRIGLRTPDGTTLSKDVLLPVRNLEPPVYETTTMRLEPGGAGLRLAGDWLARARDGGFVPGTAAALVSVSGAGAIDVAGIVRALDRFPYGCAEQLTSRALPLLYLDRVAAAAGLPADTDIPARVDDTVARVLGNQSSRGGFGLWGPGSGDLWLDAYVTDFLTRAREQGYAVSETAFVLALDNLRNQLGYAADFKQGGEGIAYALYVLARNGRVPVGDLRYYLETKLEAFATPMARAQLGAALALYGERKRADTALQSALSLWLEQADAGGWRTDYGSHVRDGAALLALAAEADTGSVDLDALAARLEQAWADTAYPSTQDLSWMLLAAHGLMQGGAAPRLRVDGAVREGPLFRSLDETALAAAPLDVANVGDRPVAIAITATGVPRVPPPAGGSGYAIERAYYDLDGRRVDAASHAQGERLVALLTIRADTPGAARLIVDDPLPAGFEIDNPNLLASGSVEGLPWLNVVEQPAYAAFRAERFVAAVERGPRDPVLFQLAYVVRAVSPGVFAHPAATVADMYRPARRGRTAAGQVEIAAGNSR